nr:probable C-terminal domain small phosphatase [Ipomoea batatas]GMC62218.1 probable C-terminal domain small phosphatase [Ipomoea batatas]GME20842.1 probable C-terminal domain small phosphatase [Ipomoea batatas]
MSRKKNRRRARSEAEKKVEQQSVNEDNTILETYSKKQSPSDVNTTVDTLMQADSADLLPFPEHQSSFQNALPEVESAAKFPSTEPMDLDLNPIENHLENNVDGKKKRKKKKNKKNCTATMTNLQVTFPNAESAVQMPAQELQGVTLPNAESAVQLPAQELQGLDMNLANILEVKSGNRKQKKRKEKNLNKPTSNVLDVDSTAKLLAPKNQDRDINMTKIEEKSGSGEKPTSNVLVVDSTAKLLVPKNQESDINMTEIEKKSESGEKSASGKKKGKKKKLNKPASNVIDVESTAEVLVPEHHEIHDVLVKPTSNVLDVDSTAKLLVPKNQESDINMTEIEKKSESGEKSSSGKKKKGKKKKLNKPASNVIDVESTAEVLVPEHHEIHDVLVKPTSNVLDVDSTAKLPVPKNQESDINMTEIEKSERGEKSASGKKKKWTTKKLNKLASNVIDVESTAEVLAPEHHERDISSHNNLEQKTANGRKRKRGENIEPTSDDQHVELTEQLLPPDNQEKKKKKKISKVKKAANNNIDNVKTATQDSLSFAREETEVLGAGSVKLCPEDVNVVSVQTEHTPTVKATTTTCENYENGSCLAFPEKNSVESCSVGTHLPSSAEVTVHDVTPLKRKLLILDLNGLLADIVNPRPKDCKADASFLGRAIFKRPFCDDFLNFCFERFNVAIWSSRSKKIIVPVVKYLLGDLRHSLAFCWDMSHCTVTRFKTLENKHKPLVCKDLRKIWEKRYPGSPWDKGDFDESNTLLLDDSPYKALLNPVHTTIFPYSYNFGLKDDNSLGPGGDLRVYLENLADAEHVQKYVEEHPFGQPAINEKSANWGFYSRVIQSLHPQVKQL